jgi:hypothetical protein
MNLPPWETHDRLCPNRRPTVAFPNSACSGCRAVVAARAEGYARGLIEGDHGGRREGYRSGYAAGKDAVMTASYAQAVAEGQRDEREANDDEWQRTRDTIYQQGYSAAMDDGWGEPGHIKAAVEAERERIRTGVTGLGHSPIYLTDLLAVIDVEVSGDN